jgi:hypothetical protein
MPAKEREGQFSPNTSHTKGKRGRIRGDVQHGHIISPSWVLHLSAGYSCIGHVYGKYRI